MTDPVRKNIVKNAKCVTDAGGLIRKAADLLDKARIDDIPKDLRFLASELEELAERVLEGPDKISSAEIVQIRDYLPTE